jgi:hypothetical protein
MGLTPLRWNSFSQAATAAFVPLAASFVPLNIQVIDQNNPAAPPTWPTGLAYPNKYASWGYRFSVAAGTLPAWVQPGTALKIAASVTLPNNATVPVNESFTVSDFYVVVALDPLGTYFDANAPRAGSGFDASAITQLVAQTALDNGAGNVPTPLVNLLIQAQKVMFSASVGSVILAPSVTPAGVAPYSITVTAGQGEYEADAPLGAKFDLADWQVKQGGAGSTLTVRFL